jgi:hypothetical protein
LNHNSGFEMIFSIEWSSPHVPLRFYPRAVDWRLRFTGFYE